MKSLINRLDQMLHRFKKLIKLIDKQASMKSVVKSVLGALLLSFLSLLLPVLTVINMFIYTKLTFFLAILLVIMVVAWPFIYYYFYYRLLKNYHPSIEDINITLPYWVESSLIATVLFVIGIIVLSIIF